MGRSPAAARHSGETYDKEPTHVIRQWVPAWSLVVAACAASGTREVAVRPGIDVLLTDSIHLVEGRRVGLLTNQTGVDRRGVSDVDRLLQAGVNLTALFSPEHGFRGALEEENIGHGVDSATGLPVYSLYGDVRAPTPAMLQNLDVVLVDLQDIGARPYTYISTLLLTLEAAAAERKPVVVLDRPNPIAGVTVQGDILDTAFATFVGMLPVPLRHGMTMGELARFGAARRGLSASLLVVPVAGWDRGQWFDETGLPWVRPSPNMPDVESATHYPGIVVFEGTNLSVGRGTPIAFQVVGAPWLDPARVRARVGEVPGVLVSDTAITPIDPTDHKYPAQRLPALKVRAADRGIYDPTLLAARLLAAIREVHRDRLSFNPPIFDRLAGSDAWRLAILRGESGEQTWQSWQPAVAEFTRLREAYLLYR
jgi:uncharacterized protein YbbC (DUF1343 family)